MPRKTAVEAAAPRLIIATWLQLYSVSPEKARPVCKRYAYLSEHLATGGLTDDIIRDFHKHCDAQASQAADTTKPPERTLWHAFYHPEERRVRLSYYLGDERWENDWNADSYVDNEFGGADSVLNLE